MHKNADVLPGVAVSRASTRLQKGGHRRIGVESFKQWFLTEDTKVLFAYGCLFGGVKDSLKKRASEPTPEGRNATYWLVRLMEHDKIPASSVVSFLQRSPHSVPCPFGKKWDFTNAYNMCRVVTTSELIDQLKVAHSKNTRPSQQLLERADKGDDVALDGYIRHYYYERGRRYSDIAGALRSRVKVPQLEGSKNWQAHMVFQYLSGVTITEQEPDGYQDVITESKRKTRREGTARYPKFKSECEQISKSKRKARYESNSSGSDYDQPGPSGIGGVNRYPVRTRQIPGAFGVLVSQGYTSDSESSSEEEFVPVVRKERPKTLGKQKRSTGKAPAPRKVMKLQPKKVPVNEPELPAEEALDYLALDYSTLDFKLLMQMAQEKDPLAITEYVCKLSSFIDEDEVIMAQLANDRIRPEKGRWTLEKLTTYREMKSKK